MSLSSLQQKYAEEAAKRRRPEGLGQFLTLKESSSDKLTSLVEDIWADHDALNAGAAPLMDGATYKFLILGAGYGGLLHAVRLIQAGVADGDDDIRLVESAGGFGGAWYWNRYPGLHCDVESYSYMPLLEETGYMPRNRYASGPELREHAERIGDLWQLKDKTLFRAEVKAARWNAVTGSWMIEIEERCNLKGVVEIKGIKVYARYFIVTGGIHTRPQAPKVPGLESFAGPLFHTARWNYDVTGGSPTEPKLTGFRGKRVGIVGTGATAVQLIPHVAKWASEFNGPHNKASDENLVNDSWTSMPAFSALIGSPTWGIIEPTEKHVEDHVKKLYALDQPRSDAIRAYVDDIVTDASTADKLKAWYPVWCKRPAFSDTYLQTFNQPNVHLVDTDGKGISSVTGGGIITNGQEYPLDILILSTGYRTPVYASGSPAARAGIQVFGRDGLQLDEKWLNEGVATLHGIYTHGFPNLFFVGQAQSGAAANFVLTLDVMASHIAEVVKQAESRVEESQVDVIIEVEREAEEIWTAECVKRAAWYAGMSGCTPGLATAEGEALVVLDGEDARKKSRASGWSEGMESYMGVLETWRSDGLLRGLHLSFHSRIAGY